MVKTALEAGIGQQKATRGPSLPNARIADTGSAAAFGGIAAQQNIQAGQSTMRGAAALFDVQEQKDALVLTDFDLQMQREAQTFAYDPQNGLLNTKGAAAMDSSKAWDAKVQEMRKKYMGMTKVPRIQERLGVQIDKLHTSMRDTYLRHESQERRSYGSELATSQAGIATETAALNWNNPKIFDEQWETVKKATLVKAQADGLSVDGTNLALKEQRSLFNTARLTSMLTSNQPGTIVEAKKAYDDARAAGELTYADVIKMDNLFDAVYPKANAAAQMANLTSGATLDSIPADVLFEAQFKQESGGKQFNADGTVVTSSAGAIGFAQVMPETGPEAARLAGLPWDETKFKTDATYNKTLGMAYFNTQKERFGSNALALAAYNAGPEMIQDWIDGTNRTGKNASGLRIGDPRKGEVSVQDFLARIPFKETREYVPKIMQKVGLGQGMRIDPQRAAEVANNMDAESGQELLKMVENQNKAFDEARESRKKGIVEAAAPYLQDSNGDWTKIPPELRAEAIQAGVWDQITKYTGTSDPNLVVRLTQMDSDELSRVDFASPEISLSLSAADREKFAAKQTDAAKGGEDSLMSDRISKVAKNQLLANGINPAPKDKNGAREYMKVVAAVERQAATFKAQNGKAPSNDDIIKMVDSTFMEGRVLSLENGKTKQKSGTMRDVGPGEKFALIPPDDDIVNAVKKYADQVGIASIAAQEPSWIEGVELDGMTQYGLSEQGVVALYTKLRTKGGYNDDQILFFGEQ